MTTLLLYPAKIELKDRTIRNQGLIKKVLSRDLGICCCCGLEASEVHHITPLCFGGEDYMENMVSMCHIDHKYAPNNKEDFDEYIKSGGFLLNYAFGKALNTYIQENSGKKDFDINKAVRVCRETLIILQKCCVTWGIEKYGVGLKCHNSK